jgi:type VI secretion system protein ImpF
MSSPGSFDPLMPSLLDRLSESGPSPAAGSGRRYQVLAELRQAVRRDLENLLNARWRCTEAADVPAALQGSLVNYGLPDFSSGSSHAAQEPDLVYAAVKEAIERFEPRLRDVRVRAAGGQQGIDRTLRFHIEAVLCAEPWQEAVRFNTVLEPITGMVTVKPVEKP